MIFAEYGCPDTVVFDNGLCFTSCEFKQAMENMDVLNTNSSSHPLQSNRSVEKECSNC